MMESYVLSWNSKVANAILAQGLSSRRLLGLSLERESLQHIDLISASVCKKETRKKNHCRCSTKPLCRDLLPGIGGSISPPKHC